MNQAMNYEKEKVLEKEYKKLKDKAGFPRLDVDHKINKIELEENEDELI